MTKVLIVDDAAFMRMAIKTMLVKNGFEIAGEAEDGEAGVKKYKECRPDVVTLDITMPQMDGIQALRAILNFDSKASTLFSFLSAIKATSSCL
jgi:two-component system chemotaxis response regulator CheY